ncbi:MAG TPA: preprotein translocase subunit YajC [Pseudonocardiaceae bacterium]|jgi:preprotein translocase subunit YajC|nr:preprotein translocase subunit YajC [Pseudonocardiaceae bacterium]
MSAYLIPVLLVVLVGFMFFGTRKQKRAMQQQQDMQKSLSFGDRVMTTSGLYGTIVTTSDDTVELEIAEGLVTTWLRQAVREKVVDSTVPELADDDVETVDDEVADYEDVEAEHTEAVDETEGAEEHEDSEKETAEVAQPLENSGKKSS